MRVASGAALSAASTSSFSSNKSRTWQNYGAGVMQAILACKGSKEITQTGLSASRS
jgi:hypothetical protein